MSNLKSAFSTLNSRKVKIFLLFLLCSFLAWSISKLSEDYESRARFQVVYEAIPDSLLFRSEGNKELSVKIKASGFQFLGYALSPKTFTLNLSKVLEQDGTYFLTANTVKNQIDNQLPNSVSLLELGSPLHYTDLYVVATKKVPVHPKLGLRLEKNHMLQGKLVVTPDSIKIKGPKEVLSTIYQIQTEPFELVDLAADFSESLRIRPLDSFGNIVMDIKQVKVSGNVVRFSEKEFVIPIVAKNIPEGYRLRMFPDQLRLVAKAGIERLKELTTSDFSPLVDYKLANESKYLSVTLESKPEHVFSVRLLTNEVEFVLEKL